MSKTRCSNVDADVAARFECVSAGGTHVLFGRGRRLERETLEKFVISGDAFVVCSRRAAREAPTTTLVDALRSDGAEVFDRSVRHVPREIVEEGIGSWVARPKGFIVSIGGGSAIGIGKAIAVGVSGRQTRSVDHVVFPTTYSGSELTSTYGLTNRALGNKETFRDERARPTSAIYDPDLTVRLPQEVAGASGMNALAHCLEVLLQSPPNPICRAAALLGTRELVAALPGLEARVPEAATLDAMMTGSFLAAESIVLHPTSLHHALCQALGGATGASHGALNAVLLPHTFKFIASSQPGCHVEEVCRSIIGDGGRGADSQLSALIASASDSLLRLAKGLGLPLSLRDLGIERGALKTAAASTFNRSASHRGPRQLQSWMEIHELLEEAW